MRVPASVLALVLAAGALLTGCSGCGHAPPHPAAQSTSGQAPPAAAQSSQGKAPPQPAAPSTRAEAPPAARITQFYATAPQLALGEHELLCYGTENARTVRLTPPLQELSAALARCVEVNPTQTTRYTLTAEGAGGPPATEELTVTVGPPPVKIIDVTVSALSVARGDLVSLCYRVENAARVEIDPIHFRGASRPSGCALDYPRKTTTYLLTATGVEGSRDQEHVTVTVH